MTDLDKQAMNALQEHGIISDNCVSWDDVGNQDEARAWLNANNLRHIFPNAFARCGARSTEVATLANP